MSPVYEGIGKALGTDSCTSAKNSPSTSVTISIVLADLSTTKCWSASRPPATLSLPVVLSPSASVPLATLS
jgi:hypothetical protein